MNRIAKNLLQRRLASERGLNLNPRFNDSTVELIPLKILKKLPKQIN